MSLAPSTEISTLPCIPSSITAPMMMWESRPNCSAMAFMISFTLGSVRSVPPVMLTSSRSALRENSGVWSSGHSFRLAIASAAAFSPAPSAEAEQRLCPALLEGLPQRSRNPR